jgi:hypothetical protein
MKLHCLAAVALSSFLAIGCEEKKDAPVTPTAPPSTPVPTPSVSADKPAADMQTAAQNAAQSAANAGTNAMGAVQAAGADLAARAQQLYDQAQTLIKDKKWDEAEALLKQLDGLKAQLPAEWQTKIDAAHATLTNARKAVAG